MSARLQLVIGTAGHIDHGKSRLVWTLTGTDPDRLPQEKARGMTLDLGFAHVAVDECDLWFVDVPGHERFVRHMVAGATGIDVALLVVAADDGVMPQSREHAELLALLGVERTVLVLTKMDLVETEWAQQVEEDAAQLMSGLGIAPLTRVRTSAESGHGFDELRELLTRLAREQFSKERGAVGAAEWFRMPIDRAFSVAGRGTVVTGSVWHGTVKAEDELELWPSGRRVRVRDLQAGKEEKGVRAGRMRLGVNLAGVALEDVGRGCELATPGFLEPTTRMDVWLPWLRPRGASGRERIRVRLHTATSEVLAEVRRAVGWAGPTESPLGSRPKVEVMVGTAHPTGEFAQIRIPTSPLVAAWGQRIVLRDESGQHTIGGGKILRPVAAAWSKANPPHLEGLRRLLEGDASARLEESVCDAGWGAGDPTRLAARAGLPTVSAVNEALRGLRERKRIVRLAEGAAEAWVHVEVLGDLRTRLETKLAAYLKESPRSPGVARADWAVWMPRACPAKLRGALAEWLIASGAVAVRDGFVVPPGREPEMSAEDQKLLDAILKEFEQCGLAPPAFDALRSVPARLQKKAAELVKLATARGKLVRVADGLWFHAAAIEKAKQVVVAALRQRGQMTASEIKTVLGMTRKFAIPLVEYFDASKVTRREGDLRRLVDPG